MADSLGSDVVIDLLRPPTLANLRETLKTKDYDVVHFDGHGNHTTEHAYAGSYLFFENEAGERDAVHAGRLIEAIAPASIPIFVLNACRLGSLTGTEIASSVAVQLVRAGCEHVLAMSYVVRASTVSPFMIAFYDSLLAGDSTAAATLSARHALYKQVTETKSDDLPFEVYDWAIPALYTSACSDEAGPSSTRTSRTRSEVKHPAYRDALERDEDLLALERALWNQAESLFTFADASERARVRSSGRLSIGIGGREVDKIPTMLILASISL